MGYAAVLVALISIVLITKTDNVFQILGSGLFALAAVTYANKSIFSRLEKRSKKANRILKEIMSGDLKTEKVIRKKWQKEEE